MFGNNDYKGGFFNIEYSQFFLLAPKWVLGLDIQEQSLTGRTSPFYLLPDIRERRAYARLLQRPFPRQEYD
jgi:hypothetical protein